MRFSIQPEQRPEIRMRTVSIDEILSIFENEPGEKPALENYFSPTKRAVFIKDFLHFINSGLLDAKHGKLDMDKYLVFILSFQFTAPLFEISAEKELGIFYRILQKNYQSIISLAEAFGRSIVIPSFFSFVDKKTLKFYRAATHGITYRVAVPEELE